MSYITTFSQNVVTDNNNSSVAPLNAGLSFVGIAVSTLGIAGIQVYLKTDQNSTVYVEQSPGILAGAGTSVETNGVNLVGTLTKFTRDLRVGDEIWVGAQTVRIIDSIASDTALTVSVAFDANASGLSFTQHYWDLSDAYNFVTSTANLGITNQAVLAYERVRVVNASPVNQTYLRLQTNLCPIVEALPRAISEEGNLKVGVYEIEDRQGTLVKISPNGGLKTTKVVRLIGTSFTGATIDTTFWTSAVANSGTGVQTGGQFELKTNTTPNGASALQSTRSGRYVNGVSNYCRSQVDFGGAGVSNNTKRWGAFTGTAGTPTDGCMFELINSVFSIATYTGGTPTRVTNGNFNGFLGTTIDIALSGVQTYEIVYNNRYLYFYINNVLLHKATASTSPWSATLSLPIRAENYNTSGGTTDTSLKIRSFIIMRYGEMVSQPTSFFRSTTTTGLVLKIGAGNLHSVILGGTNNNGVVTLYDGLSTGGTVIYASGTIQNNTNFSLDLKGLPFYTGLFFVLSGANENVTVIYE